MSVDGYTLARYAVRFPRPLVECEGCGRKVERGEGRWFPRVGFLCDRCADAECEEEAEEGELVCAEEEA